MSIFQFLAEVLVLDRLSNWKVIGGKLPTSSSSRSSRDRSASTSVLCSVSRYRARTSSSSLDRTKLSICRSRSSYCRRTNFRRSLVLSSKVTTGEQIQFIRDLHSVEDLLHGLLSSIAPCFSNLKFRLEGAPTLADYLTSSSSA